MNIPPTCSPAVKNSRAGFWRLTWNSQLLSETESSLSELKENSTLRSA